MFLLLASSGLLLKIWHNRFVFGKYKLLIKTFFFRYFFLQSRHTIAVINTMKFLLSSFIRFLLLS